MAVESVASTVVIPHVIKGELLTDGVTKYKGVDGAPFLTPELDLNSLVWPRVEPVPAADVPVAEIIDVLVAAGERIREDPDGLLVSALDALSATSPYERRILENTYESLWRIFSPGVLWALLDGELGGADVVDSWRRFEGPTGRGGSVRACPARIVHVLAGNSAGVAAMTVARGAMTKGVHLLKMPSNDLLTASTILQAISAVAPGHPVARSFSAVYWRGGDDEVESVLLRPQFFDKIVAWGGEAAIRNAARFLGPGLELIAFDPKNSISMIGVEVFDSQAATEEAAMLGAIDATALNQEACVASRFQYVEGTLQQVDRYCELLQVELGYERPMASAVVTPPSIEIQDEIDFLRSLDPEYRVFGNHDGRGMVVRSDEPVDFFPSGKTVNVVRVDSLDDAMQYLNVSTQTVGVYPFSRKVELRDRLAAMGVQRVVKLGQSHGVVPGLAHDGFYPMHRFMRWVNDED